ncbi:MAG: DegT/DnrJ/EryC1/StrS family aminotransferase [Candidatus Latescibacterota bacterium]
MRKQPTTAFPLRSRHVIRGMGSLFDVNAIERFENVFARYTGVRHAVATGSGTTAFYLLLAAAARAKPTKNEVILPAYSVPVLIHAVRKAGLRPVYCDVDPSTLNMDPDSMAAAVSNRTLAIAPIHLFGFPMELDRALEIGRVRDLYVFEDACQALGAKLNAAPVGSLGDAGFFSLCKGKIISTFRGGIMVTNNDRIALAVRGMNRDLPLPDIRFRSCQPCLLAALSLAMRPEIYGSFYPLIVRFKDTAPHPSFHPSRFTRYGAGLGLTLLDEIESWITIRRRNGAAILEGLSGDPGLIVPRIPPGADPSYNHAPVVFRSIPRLEKAQRLLWGRGIDTARMYERPVHHIYPELGYATNPEPLPGAAFIAPRLLVIPTHPYLNAGEIESMVRTIRETGE